MTFFKKVLTLVCQVPAGKVVTYGQIACFLGSRDARKVGWALHSNKDPQTPCHRVVNRFGDLAPGFCFGGWQVQKEKLLSESVSFVSEKKVDLNHCQYQFKSTLGVDWVVNLGKNQK
ncbi:MGMT family protein [Patescibacteria group bacterium]